MLAYEREREREREVLHWFKVLCKSREENNVPVVEKMENTATNPKDPSY